MCINHTSKKPYIITIAYTKGGSAKSTNAANIGAFCADHGLRTLLIDTDTQPTLSSYYSLAETAPGGIHEFLSLRDVDAALMVAQELDRKRGIAVNDDSTIITA
nr:ParA family protein [Aggregatibacter actinomycetemcomitans]